MINNFVEQLNDFLNQHIPSDLKIGKISKWQRNSIKLDILLKKNDGFASLEDCELIHKLILMWIKKENINQIVKISVQSDSINKLLLDKSDFLENLEKQIKIELKEKIKDRRNFVGCLKEIKNDIILLQSENILIDIKLNQIKKAQLIHNLKSREKKCKKILTIS